MTAILITSVLVGCAGVLYLAGKVVRAADRLAEIERLRREAEVDQ
jgi:hypothetical protein